MQKQIKHVVKVDYSQNAKHPEKIFRTMAELIEAIRKIDKAAVKSVSSDFTHSIELDNIEISSLVSWLLELITIPDNTEEAQDEVAESVASYVEESRNTIVDALNENDIIETANAIREIQAKLDQIAETKGLKSTLNYAPINPLKLAQNMAQLAKASNQLSEGQVAYYGVAEPSVRIERDRKVDINAIKDSLANEVIEDKSELILKIKKPDLLGSSKWVFIHGSQTISAHITHEEWLDEFHDGGVSITSGDSMRCKVKIVSHYDSRGDLKSTEWEIYEVIRVSQGIEDNQIGVFGEA
jgi:hypothetical protein